jgi:hypothetical protein
MGIHLSLSRGKFRCRMNQEMDSLQASEGEGQELHIEIRMGTSYLVGDQTNSTKKDFLSNLPLARRISNITS